MNMERYARQIALPEIGVEGQKMLASARVLIVGVGGLGSPLAIYAAAAGIGTIGLIDADRVSISNLQRQILYSESHVGMPKAECAAERLKALNSGIEIKTYNTYLTAENAEEIISGYDYVVDGCDNFKTRYLINDICRRHKIVYVYGAIADFSGQAALFDYESEVDYSTLYPDREYYEQLQPNAASPVIGVTPAMIASVQLNLLLQHICHFGKIDANTLIMIDLLTLTVNKIRLSQ